MHAARSPESSAGPGIRDKAKARIGALTAEIAGTGQRDDRALIGSLIRAVEVLAQRCDELAGRLVDLESTVGEVVDVLGADLVQLRAALSSTVTGSPSAGSPENGSSGGAEPHGTVDGDG